MAVRVELLGGLDALFGTEAIAVPLADLCGAPAIKDLLAHLRARFVRDRPELFFDAQGLGVRPGILVLRNDCDWDLEGKLECPLAAGDVVAFISTLHGG